MSTANSAGFGPLKRLKIRTKLISIISLIIVMALSGMIFLATYFFKMVMETRIQQNNAKIAQVIAQKTEGDLYAIADKINLMGTTLRQEFRSPEQKRLFTSLFFENDRTMIHLGILTRNAAGTATPDQTITNQGYMADNQLTAQDFARIDTALAPAMERALAGEFMVFNASREFSNPVIAVAFPFERNDDSTIRSALFGYIKLERFLQSFTEDEDKVRTFMVNGDGELLAHPDVSMILAKANLLQSVIVQTMMKSKIDNDTRQFTETDGKRYLGSFRKTSLAGIGVIAMIEEATALEWVYKIQRFNLYILGITLTLSILIIYFFAKTLTNPILRLLAATREIEKGNFRVDIHPSSGDEIGKLTASFIDMGLGLEEREKVKNILGNMVDPVVVNEALKDLGALKRGQEKEISAFFSDVASFSTISEKLQSVDLAALLNEYLSAMTIILKEYDGVLDKYIGDAIVGIFNAPVDVAEHERKACFASLDMIRKLHELRTHWTRNNAYIAEAQAMDIRIGLNTGPAKVGFMGTEALASYTMMGDTVNLAARLEAAGKDYGVNILISEMIRSRVGEHCFTRELDLVRVKGKNEPVRLYELIARASEVTSRQKEAVELYEEGFRLYLKRDWDNAISRFTHSERAAGHKDKSAHLLIERCELYRTDPPPADWDGVFTRTHK